MPKFTNVIVSSDFGRAYMMCLFVHTTFRTLYDKKVLSIKTLVSTTYCPIIINSLVHSTAWLEASTTSYSYNFTVPFLYYNRSKKKQF